MTADLVLATRSDDAAAPSDAPVGRDFPLLKIIGTGRMAMCNPADHPAGKLGRAGLESLGLWQPVEDKVAIAESPPAAVALVARGEAPVALVFSTDAQGVAGSKYRACFRQTRIRPLSFPQPYCAIVIHRTRRDFWRSLLHRKQRRSSSGTDTAPSPRLTDARTFG
jgi:molybdate transport system substrate-binding protein